MRMSALRGDDQGGGVGGGMGDGMGGIGGIGGIVGLPDMSNIPVIGGKGKKKGKGKKRKPPSKAEMAAIVALRPPHAWERTGRHKSDIYVVGPASPSGVPQVEHPVPSTLMVVPGEPWLMLTDLAPGDSDAPTVRCAVLVLYSLSVVQTIVSVSCILSVVHSQCRTV